MRRFHAFYRYARRLRFHAAAIDLTELVTPDNADVTDILPTHFAHRLLDTVTDESTSPRIIQRLADAWRIATATAFHTKRQDIILNRDHKKRTDGEIDHLAKLVRQYGTFVQQHQQSQLAEEIQAASQKTNENAGP